MRLRALSAAFAAISLSFAAHAAPKVTFVQPQSGAVLSGEIRQSSACEVKGSNVRRVVFFLDGTQLNSDASSPWNCDLDTRHFADGAHTLTARAYDSRGNTATARVDIIISNAAAAPGGASYSGTPYFGAPIALPKAFAAADFDKGGQGVAYRDLTAGNSGGQYRTGEDVDIVSASGDPISPYAINSFQSGEWLAYTVEVAAAGIYDLAINASTNYAGTPAFHIEIDGVDVTGRIDVPGTGSWSTFQWVGKPGVALAAGKHVLKVVADAEYFNLRAVSVLASGTAGPGGGSDSGGTTDPDSGGTNDPDSGGTGDSGGTTTTPASAPSAVATFESLGLYWKPPSDPGAAGCTVRYRKSGEASWKDGLALWFDARNAECRGSLVHLAPGTSYEVELGLPGAAPSVQLGARTWSETFPVARTVVVPSGSGTLAITEGGTPGGYVLYTAAPGGSVLDAANALAHNVTIAAPYVIVRGLTLKGAQRDAIRVLVGAHDVVIEDNDISGWGRSRSGSLGVDLDSGVRAECGNADMRRLVIQRNRIHHPRYGANSWSSGHPEGPQGITLGRCAGGNHVIRHNEITSADGHYFNDGIGGSDNFTTTGFPDADSDIYGNVISHAWDDAIEAEGGNRNVRIWGNYMDRTAVGVATTVTATGPVYVFRNVYNRSRHFSHVPPDSDGRNVFAKSGSTSLGGGRRYVLHNTLLQATEPGSVYPLGAGLGIRGTGSSQPITNTVSRNNVLHLWKSSELVISQAGAGNDFGYDLYNGTLTVPEPGGIAGTPLYAPGHGWTSESGGRYALDPASPGYDAGQRIANFNDAYTGARPDIGAHESGTPEMRFGRNAASVGAPYRGAPFVLPGAFAAVDFDSGGQGIGYRDLTAGNAGGQYRPSEDVDIIASGDPLRPYAVNGFQTGEWLAYTVNVPASGKYDLAIQAASNQASPSAFHLEVDGVDVTGTIAVPGTGSWSSYQWVVKQAVSLAAGTRVVKLVADAEYFNVQSLSILASVESAPAYAGTPYSGSPIALPKAFAAVDFDHGGQGVAYHDLTAGNAGGQYRTSEDVDIVNSGDALTPYAVNGFQTGEWLAYTVNVPASGKYDLAIQAASNYATPGAFRIEVDGVDATGSIAVPSTGSWSSFQWVGKQGIDLAAGMRVVKLVADAEYFNVQALSILASATPSGGQASGGNLQFSCSFENSPTECGFVEQAKVPGRATLVSIARDGSRAVRLYTEPGDSNVSGSGTWERNDLRLPQADTDCYEGREAWWAHSVLFPSDYVVPNSGGVVMDFHHTGSSGQANFHIDAMSYGLRLRGYGGATVDSGRYEVVLGPVVRNVWYDFVYHVKWSSGSDGFMHAWVNGVKKLTHYGPTLYAGMGCYLKLANYHDPFGQASAVIHDRVRRGAAWSDVSLTPLEGMQ